MGYGWLWSMVLVPAGAMAATVLLFVLAWALVVRLTRWRLRRERLSAGRPASAARSGDA